MVQDINVEAAGPTSTQLSCDAKDGVKRDSSDKCAIVKVGARHNRYKHLFRVGVAASLVLNVVLGVLCIKLTKEGNTVSMQYRDTLIESERITAVDSGYECENCVNTLLKDPCDSGVALCALGGTNTWCRCGDTLVSLNLLTMDVSSVRYASEESRAGDRRLVGAPAHFHYNRKALDPKLSFKTYDGWGDGWTKDECWNHGDSDVTSEWTNCWWRCICRHTFNNIPNHNENHLMVGSWTGADVTGIMVTDIKDEGWDYLERFPAIVVCTSAQANSQCEPTQTHGSVYLNRRQAIFCGTGYEWAGTVKVSGAISSGFQWGPGSWLCTDDP